MAQNKPIIDGNSDWSGGFDSSRSAAFIDRNQYALGVNVKPSDTFGGICNRPGFRHIRIIFDNPNDGDIYHNGNIQGEGYYFDGKEYHLVCSVDGWVFDFKLINNLVLDGVIVNRNSQNNPNILNVYITRVPFGCIVSDGESLPFYIYKGVTRRTDPSKKEMGACLMSVYVQNRLFFVKQDRQNIWASDINNPVGVSEVYLSNIYGFITPEPQDIIIAIGKQKTILQNATGGNLAWATNRNQYSVNVIGARTQWGATNGSGTGFVTNTITDVGAVSPYSYEAFNGNLYFRNYSYGLSSIKLAEYQNINQDTYFSGSLEANVFFNNDSELLLKRCQTKGHNSKIYTTVAPQLKDNTIIHNGLVVYAPNQYVSSNTKVNKRYESVYTGVRPWCMTVLDDYNNGSLMFIHSHDYDGVNRIYLMDETLDFDINKDGERVEIESKILTRAYTFGDDFQVKNTTNAFYSIKDIPRNLNVKIDSRYGEHGRFSSLWDFNHLVKDGVFKPVSKDGAGNGLRFTPCAVHSQNRDLISVRTDTNAKCAPMGGFFSCQDLFTFKGAYTLRRWARVAITDDLTQSVTATEKPRDPEIYNELRIFTHKISI